VALLPVLLNGLSSDIATSAHHGAILFNLFLRLLPQFSLPPRGSQEDLQLRDKLGLTDEDASTLAQSAKSLMLFVPLRVSKDSTSPKACPGLSSEEHKFLTLESKPQTWDPSDEAGLNLTEAKINMAKFLSSGAILDQERFLPAFYASGDPNSRISDIADDMLKRTLPNISLEDPALINLLFDAYFGKGDVQPVRMPLRIKIIGLLLKSKEATGSVENITRLVEEGFSPGEKNETTSRPQTNLGREASKLRAAVFAFTNWVARIGTPSNLERMAPTVVSKLRDFIESQGWPSSLPEHRSPGALAQRGFAYESIGLFAKSSPDHLIQDPELDLMRFLFRSLSEDSSGETISVSIDEALGSTLGALSSSLSNTLYEAIRSLLLQQISLEVDDESPSDSRSVIRRSTRFAATRFSNRVLAFHDVIGRWIDLVGLSNSRNEVVEEARRGLDPYWYQKLNSDASIMQSQDEAKFRFPTFSEFADSILGEPDSSSKETPLVLDRYEGKSINIRHPAVAFCRMLLVAEAMTPLNPLPVEEHYSKQIDTLVNRDLESRKAIQLHAQDLAANDKSHSGLLAYVGATFSDLTSGDSQTTTSSGNHFIEICSLVGNEAVQSVAGRIRALQPLILANDIYKRLVAAQAFGILGANKATSSSTLRDMISSFHMKLKSWKVAVGAEINQIHGSMNALAFFYSRAIQDDTNSSAYSDGYLSMLKSVLEILEESTDKTLQEGAYTSLEQLGLFSIIRPSQLPSPHQSTIMVDKLHIPAKKGNESAIRALSRFGMACDETQEDGSLLDKIRDQIYELHELRQLEVQFVVGEGLSCLAAGWESKSLLAAQDIQGTLPKNGYRKSTLTTTIDKILKDCRGTKPSLRKASIVWLLCLTQYCGHLEPIQERLRLLQLTFKSFLSDRDEVIQEAASRGLSIVYDISSKDLRDDLVRDLVGSFTGGNANLSGTITQESELFEPGALPTGEGSSITSYKDVSSKSLHSYLC
jgi:proteasome component ECM29